MWIQDWTGNLFIGRTQCCNRLIPNDRTIPSFPGDGISSSSRIDLRVPVYVCLAQGLPRPSSSRSVFQPIPS